VKTRNEMNFQRLATIEKQTNYRRTNASVPVLLYGALNDVLDGMLAGVDERFERGVELATGNEVSAMTLLSAVRRLVHRF